MTLSTINPAFGSQATSISSTDSSDPNTGAVNTSSHHKGLPAVAIGLITAALVLIGLFSAIFVIRRVHQRRRADRRTRWAPVMAQNRSNGGNGSTGERSSVRSSFATTFDYGLRAQSPIPPADMPAVPPVPYLPEPKRLSADSDQSQWLMLDRPSNAARSNEDLLSGDAPLTPLSVAPFTPSESFKFPQPPKSASEADADPFSDDKRPDLSRGITEASAYSQPSFSAQPVIEKGVAATVRRPFAPSLPDELYVTPGQLVTIEEMFDDGWNLVKAADGARGLVPLACFDEVDQPNGKRRSSLIEHTN